MDLLEIVARIARERPELDIEVRTEVWEQSGRAKEFQIISILDAPDYFSSDCIFDSCTDEEKKFLLEFFLSEQLENVVMEWGGSCELSKLLAKCGGLVTEKTEKAVGRAIEDHRCQRQLYLSGLAVMSEGEELAIRMLDLVDDDFRDGLFLACYRMNSEKVWRKLEQSFVAWSSVGGWGQGTGEVYALSRLLLRWKEVGFVFDSKLRDVVASFYAGLNLESPV